MAKHLITGGAGFIGVNLVARLLAEGHSVCVVDDLSQPAVGASSAFEGEAGYAFFAVDCADAVALEAVFSAYGQVDEVWHLAANSDIPAGIANPQVDLHRTFMTKCSKPSNCVAQSRLASSGSNCKVGQKNDQATNPRRHLQFNRSASP